MRGELTKDDYDILRAPFDVHAVYFRLGSRKPGGKMTVLTYIDARLVTERLSEVDPNWQADYGVSHGWGEYDGEILESWLRHHAPLECSLTVKGTTRTDVGQLPLTASKPDIEKYPFKEKKDYDTGVVTQEAPRWEISDKHMKALYSDSLKRAAVNFGIGAYLYSMKGFEVGKDGYEKGFLTAKGTQQMKDRYQKIVEHERFIARFGEVRKYGDEIVSEIG